MYTAKRESEKDARSFYNDWAFAYQDERSSQLWLEFVGKYFLADLSPSSRILDVGCGKGELVNELINKGYQASGIDLSEEMLNFARQNAPRGEFIVGDICSLEMPPTYQAIISSSTVFNYILSLEDLEKAFRNVYNALLAKGWFGFDLSEGEIVSENDSSIAEEFSGDFADNYAWLQRTIYTPANKLWQIKHITFRLLGRSWQRKDVDCQAKGYSRTEVQAILENIGFEKVVLHDVSQDVPLLTDSRIVYVFRKP
ncbi:MAG: methyltransferase domain-containing protein [Oscillatoria sp. PMC 1051.18]|nr:methyltransferase domain-containing protein [Oscillatoria sp. PMC 1050.18]MEC5029454.1 methyltransferase domain-containing protein [Oscillatoria sp. PMC 1051.18]